MKKLSVQLYSNTIYCFLLKLISCFHEVTIMPPPPTSPTSQSHSFTQGYFLKLNATQAFLYFFYLKISTLYLLGFNCFIQGIMKRYFREMFIFFTHFACTSYTSCENTVKYTGRRKAEGPRIQKSTIAIFSEHFDSRIASFLP